MNSVAALRRFLSQANLPVEGDQARQLVQFLSLLEKWNRRINITASADWRSVRPLLEEALWAAGFYPDHPTRHLDIGSGAGFPAIPMRILKPQMRLQLLESRWKRAVFLETVVQNLGLQAIRVESARSETFLRNQPQEPLWDFVSWKGLRLSRRELALLLTRTDRSTQFWVFHGARLPFKDEQSITDLELYRRERLPFRNRCYLSIFRKADVSRET